MQWRLLSRSTRFCRHMWFISCFYEIQNPGSRLLFQQRANSIHVVADGSLCHISNDWFIKGFCSSLHMELVLFILWIGKITTNLKLGSVSSNIKWMYYMLAGQAFGLLGSLYILFLNIQLVDLAQNHFNSNGWDYIENTTGISALEIKFYSL